MGIYKKSKIDLVALVTGNGGDSLLRVTSLSLIRIR